MDDHGRISQQPQPELQLEVDFHYLVLNVTGELTSALACTRPRAYNVLDTRPRGQEFNHPCRTPGRETRLLEWQVTSKLSDLIFAKATYSNANDLIKDSAEPKVRCSLTRIMLPIYREVEQQTDICLGAILFPLHFRRGFHIPCNGRRICRPVSFLCCFRTLNATKFGIIYRRMPFTFLIDLQRKV